MKNIYRIISIFLICVFLLCACQGTTPEIVPEYDAGVESADLDGFKVKWGWATGIANDVVFGYVVGTAHADMALEKEKQVEKTLNCVIDVEYTERTAEILRTSVMSGSLYFDIVEKESFTLVNDVRAGYLTGLFSLIDVANTEKWGTPNMLQSLIWEDDLYGVVPYAWPELMYTSSGYPIVVNETLVSQLGQSDPREYVESGTWTWDKFEEVLAAYTYDEGERTIYGMAANDTYFVVMMFLSNGNAISSLQDGQVVAGAYTNNAYVAFERARKIYWESCKDYFWPGDPWGGVGLELFKNGDVVMYTAQPDEVLGGAASILYHVDNVGLLPYPQGPDATPGVYPTYHESLPYSTAIPVNAKDPEATAIVLSEMFEPFDEYKTKEDVIKYMGSQIFFDERDARILVNMVQNTEYGFFLEGARGCIQNMIENTDPISSILESHEDSYAKIVEDFIAPHYEGRVAVYGE